MRFIVEVPIYLKVEVDARDAAEAAALAQAAEVIYSQETDPEVHDPAILSFELAALDPEEDDREPDVYVCRGGKLNQVGPGDLILPLDDDC